jgi:hypothetical protein
MEGCRIDIICTVLYVSCSATYCMFPVRLPLTTLASRTPHDTHIISQSCVPLTPPACACTHSSLSTTVTTTSSAAVRP